MCDNKDQNHHILKSEGYCLIKNFFSLEEVKNLRSLVEINKHKNQDVYISIIESELGKALLSSKYFDLANCKLVTILVKTRGIIFILWERVIIYIIYKVKSVI